MTNNEKLSTQTQKSSYAIVLLLHFVLPILLSDRAARSATPYHIEPLKSMRSMYACIPHNSRAVQVRRVIEYAKDINDESGVCNFIASHLFDNASTWNAVAV